MKRKQSEIYAKILKAFMVGTLACGLVGCASSDNEQKKEETTEKQQETKNVIPTEIMSKEETMELTEGTIIELKDLKKMPDEAVLEENGLTIAYNVQEIGHDLSGNKTTEYSLLYAVLPKELEKEGKYVLEVSDGTITSTFQNIQLLKISGYYQDENGGWHKQFTDSSGTTYLGNPVISEKVLSELGE